MDRTNMDTNFYVSNGCRIRYKGFKYRKVYRLDNIT